jgi:hypothetical protein
MKPITLRVTADELNLLISLASDQLFRREFIDPKMPGHKFNPAEMRLAKALMGRLKLLADPSARDKVPATRQAASPAPSNGSKRQKTQYAV